MNYPLIEVRSLVKNYYRKSGWKRICVTALDDISFSLHRGQTLALVGEAGSGKSTIARLLTGVEHPTSGSILLEGIPVGETLEASQRAEIRLIQQSPSTILNPRRRIGKQLEEPLRHFTLLDPLARQQKVLETLLDVGLLREHADFYPPMLSSSQKQRVALAKALICDPKVIVIDETLSSVDPTVRAQLINLLVKLQRRRKLAYLLISHNLSVVKHMANEVMVIHNGKLMEQQPTQALFSAPIKEYTRKLVSAHDALLGINQQAG